MQKPVVQLISRSVDRLVCQYFNGHATRGESSSDARSHAGDVAVRDPDEPAEQLINGSTVLLVDRLIG
jgi:hypothetical protein